MLAPGVTGGLRGLRVLGVCLASADSYVIGTTNQN